MKEIRDCPVCGKKGVVIHLNDTYDRADYGWVCGCPAYKIDDGVHKHKMKASSIVGADDAIDKWNKIAKVLRKR